jgi:threonine dehydrogenase-like Zn-dependent dehydrogenase
MTGLYTERGIHRLDGFFTRFVVDNEQYVLKVPPQLRDLAVFSEPLSIVEKGIEQIKLIQSRLPWTCSHPEHDFQSGDWGGCKTALVVGAGPLGLLATGLLRLAGTQTYVADIVPEDTPKAHLVRHMDAVYIDAHEKEAAEIVTQCSEASGTVDIIFEAAGAAAIAIELMNFMSRSSIYVMTGIPRKEMMLQVDGAQLVRQLVRYNQVIVGSINSNRSHFQMALDDMGEVNTHFGGMLAEMVTNRFRLEEYEQAFALDASKHIKTVIEVEPWD